jgi:hypothetical protein
MLITLFEAIENEQIEGYVTATTFLTNLYIVRRPRRFTSLDKWLDKLLLKH